VRRRLAAVYFRRPEGQSVLTSFFLREEMRRVVQLDGQGSDSSLVPRPARGQGMSSSNDQTSSQGAAPGGPKS
jgi:hypothetical protein